MHQGCPLTLRDEEALGIFERKILRCILGGIQVNGSRRRYNLELYTIYKQLNVVKFVKLQRLKWAGHLARVNEDRCSTVIQELTSVAVLSTSQLLSISLTFYMLFSSEARLWSGIVLAQSANLVGWQKSKLERIDIGDNPLLQSLHPLKIAPFMNLNNLNQTKMTTITIIPLFPSAALRSLIMFRL
ncbi:hypothetical protein TNCV_1627431 [Trichonephila clavipes]|nr:hypothetical protein TNCV_1627431 [Trichonephila clavipes]